MKLTWTVVEVAFGRKVYPAGSMVEILSPLEGDGAFCARFADGEETYLAAWRVEAPPSR